LDGINLILRVGTMLKLMLGVGLVVLVATIAFVVPGAASTGAGVVDGSLVATCPAPR
jgi:hypothetical protein